MENNILPRWLCLLMSYMATFVCGAYTYAALHGKPPAIGRVILTIFFGLMFFYMSRRKKDA